MRSLFYMGNNDKLNFIPDDEKYNYFIKQTTKFKEFINENRNKSFRQAQVDALNIINKDIKDSPTYLTESKPHYTELINIYKTLRDNLQVGTLTFIFVRKFLLNILMKLILIQILSIIIFIKFIFPH